MDSNAVCLVKCYATFSQVWTKIWKFVEHCTFAYDRSFFPSILWLHLLKSKHLVMSLFKFNFKCPCVYEFLNHFLHTAGRHLTTTFFSYNVTYRSFCKATALEVHSYCKGSLQAEQDPLLREWCQASKKQCDENACIPHFYIKKQYL